MLRGRGREIGGKVVAGALALAIGGGALAVVVESEREGRQSAEQVLPPAVRAVQKSARKAENGAYELANVRYIAQEGWFQYMVEQMETATPYPPVKVKGKVVGREVPEGFTIPEGASPETLRKIFRDGKRLTSAEATEIVRADKNTTRQQVLNSNVNVRAHIAPDGTHYAADAAEFGAYRALCDDLTEATTETIPVTLGNVKRLVDLNTMAVTGFGQALNTAIMHGAGYSDYHQPQLDVYSAEHELHQTLTDNHINLK